MVSLKDDTTLRKQSSPGWILRPAFPHKHMKAYLVTLVVAVVAIAIVFRIGAVKKIVIGAA